MPFSDYGLWSARIHKAGSYQPWRSGMCTHRQRLPFSNEFCFRPGAEAHEHCRQRALPFSPHSWSALERDAGIAQKDLLCAAYLNGARGRLRGDLSIPLGPQVIPDRVNDFETAPLHPYANRKSTDRSSVRCLNSGSQTPQATQSSEMDMACRDSAPASSAPALSTHNCDAAPRSFPCVRNPPLRLTSRFKCKLRANPQTRKRVVLSTICRDQNAQHTPW